MLRLQAGIQTGTSAWLPAIRHVPAWHDEKTAGRQSKSILLSFMGW
jgi:hypothetical protein